MKINYKLILFLFKLYTAIVISSADCEFNSTCKNQIQSSNENNHELTKCPNVKSSEVFLSRKRRALKFPDNSNFVVSIAYTYI